MGGAVFNYDFVFDQFTIFKCFKLEVIYIILTELIKLLDGQGIMIDILPVKIAYF